MKEYIEKTDAINLLWLYADESCASVVSDFESISTADVVEVVRCKDCIYYRNKQCESADFWNAFHGDDIGVHFIPDPDFYCACGERRKGNA